MELSLKIWFIKQVTYTYTYNHIFTFYIFIVKSYFAICKGEVIVSQSIITVLFQIYSGIIISISILTPAGIHRGRITIVRCH